MRLRYKSFWYKSTSVLRYIMARAYYGSKFKCSQLSMLGKKVDFHILNDGIIECKGRLIVDDYVMLFSKGILTIGNKMGINRFSRIVCHEKITIGENVTIGQMVSILDHDHAYGFENGEMELEGYITAPIQIGNNIWIGDKVTILKGVTIGDNVVIGAHTLVNKDVPDNCIIGGNPFKILKSL